MRWYFRRCKLTKLLQWLLYAYARWILTKLNNRAYIVVKKDNLDVKEDNNLCDNSSPTKQAIVQKATAFSLTKNIHTHTH